MQEKFSLMEEKILKIFSRRLLKIRLGYLTVVCKRPREVFSYPSSGGLKMIVL